GAQGQAGPAGAQGEVGPQGPVGPPGAQGPQGPVIVSFTFVDAAGVTFVCDDPDGDLNYQCAPQTGGAG
ncbi:MAG TPA: hypothetical protein VFE69_17085, partial [Ilumatobacteraceae bacterium]|nr:hypothetical protein [Ilumatobacteraceae bacterium]